MKPTDTDLRIAELRANLLARQEPGRARDLLVEVGVPWNVAAHRVLTARYKWRLLAIAVATVPLQGCFFVFIPGSLIDKVAGNPTYCVSEPRARVGATFVMPSGQVMRVTRVAGPSPYVCRAQPPERQVGVDAEVVS